MKPLIIGQAPARGNDDKPAFHGKSGARLAQLAGVGTTGEDLLYHFDTVNLLPRWPGKVGKGDVFDMKVAKLYAGELIHVLKQEQPRIILLMGRKVRKAMGINGHWEYLELIEAWGHKVYIFPHPSGVNRWWNDPLNYIRASMFLTMVAEHGTF